MKRSLIVLLVLFFSVNVAGESATIESLNPNSETVSKGQSFSVAVSYTTNSANSCDLGFVESSLPSNWDAENSVDVEPTSGSTSTVESPKLTPGTVKETDVSLELQCETSTAPVNDKEKLHVSSQEPPFLEGSLTSSPKISVQDSETYTVSFSVSNSGGSPTENARAVMSYPQGYEGPDSVMLKEAGQEDGVIRPGKSIGTVSFNLDTDSPENGSLSIEFTSSDIGITESISVELNAPSTSTDTSNEETENLDDSNEESSSSSGAGGGFSLQNTTDTSNTSNTSNTSEKDDRENEEGYVCGNNVCESEENWESCSADCDKPVKVGEVEKALETAQSQIGKGEPGYEKLQEAQEAFENGEYQKAESLAAQAISSNKTQENADSDQIFPVISVLTILLVAIPIIAYVKRDTVQTLVASDQDEVVGKLEELSQRVALDLKEGRYPQDAERAMSQLNRAEELIEKEDYERAWQILEQFEKELENSEHRNRL